MINYCKKSNNAEVVAICDKLPEALNAQRKNAEGLNIAFYDHFDDFILHDGSWSVKPVPAITKVPPSIRESGNNTRPVLKVQHFFLK